VTKLIDEALLRSSGPTKPLSPYLYIKEPISLPLEDWSKKSDIATEVIAGRKTNMIPDINAAFAHGTVTKKNVLDFVLPKSELASNRLLGRSLRLVIKGNIMKGKNMYVVPIITHPVLSSSFPPVKKSCIASFNPINFIKTLSHIGAVIMNVQTFLNVLFLHLAKQ
jgi:hypothetical protein